MFGEVVAPIGGGMNLSKNIPLSLPVIPLEAVRCLIGVILGGGKYLQKTRCVEA